MLLEIVNGYSTDFKVKFGGDKSKVMVINGDEIDRDRQWNIGEVKIGMLCEHGCASAKGEKVAKAMQWWGRLSSVAKYRANKYECVIGIWKYVALPSIMFGMNVMAWNGGDLEKLEVLQNRVGRVALSAPKWRATEALRGDLGWSLFSERLIKAVLNYKVKIERMDNKRYAVIMSELFKSALGYLGNESSTSDDYVGRHVEVEGLKLRIKRVIAEGGFAFVYVAQETSTSKFYALKRLLASDEAARSSIEQEIAFSRQLSGHPNIVDFIASCIIDRNQSTARTTEFLLVSELCSGGSMIDVLRLLEDKSLPLDQVCSVVYQTARAVQHMQMQDPPILHRDLKVENLLLSDDGFVKLCDFGSATTSHYIIDDSWTVQRRSMLEDEMASHTTPMYRAPEMLDTWSNFPINSQADMWALGCILYYLCYLKHPFEDSAKLRIINGNYSIPAKDGRYDCLHPLIRGLLCVDPRERFTVSDVLERLAAVAESKGFNMKSALTIKRASIDCTSPVHHSDSNRLAIFSSAEPASEQPGELRRRAPVVPSSRPALAPSSAQACETWNNNGNYQNGNNAADVAESNLLCNAVK
ncbi:Protein kinase domain [Trinorchestia longiramus]|nr:Protein kinase domain [Trinorchestia longiramus]